MKIITLILRELETPDDQGRARCSLATTHDSQKPLTTKKQPF